MGLIRFVVGMWNGVTNNYFCNILVGYFSYRTETLRLCDYVTVIILVVMYFQETIGV